MGQRGLFTGSCRTANLSRTGTNGLREDQKHYRTQRYQWPDLSPSSARDLNNPQIDQYLAKYVRGSNGMDHVQRIKILKLMWDAIGSEFGGRHELYEINYSGSQDEIRLQCLRQAQSSGNMDKMMAMVDRCLSEYDQNGWTVPHLHNNDDINMLDKLLK
ncbi:4-hydroxyphenylacetate 3-monooxygenase oxygenase component [Escherichia coli]|nr:4-hydroxyphenylacetate 3-monooxygenase oxygenase component [Escherichia coli]